MKFYSKMQQNEISQSKRQHRIKQAQKDLQSEINFLDDDKNEMFFEEKKTPEKISRKASRRITIYRPDVQKPTINLQTEEQVLQIISQPHKQKLLSKLQKIKNQIYIENIAQPNNLKDEYNEDFRAELMKIFECDVQNSSEFLEGVQVQMLMEKQFDQKIQALIDKSNDILISVPQTEFELAQQLVQLMQQLNIPQSLLKQLLANDGDLVPLHQCRRYDSFREYLEQFLHLTINQPLTFLEQCIQMITTLCQIQQKDEQTTMPALIKQLGYDLNLRFKDAPFDLIGGELKKFAAEPDEDEPVQIGTQIEIQKLKKLQENRAKQSKRMKSIAHISQKSKVEEKVVTVPDEPVVLQSKTDVSKINNILKSSADYQRCLEEKGFSNQQLLETVQEALYKQNELDQQAVREMVEELKVKPTINLIDNKQDKDLSNTKKIMKLLQLFQKIKDSIYPDIIRQFSVEDKFDEVFREELGQIFQTTVRNASDFILGVQQQLKLERTYKDKINRLKTEISLKLDRPYENYVDMLKDVRQIYSETILPDEILLQIQAKGVIIEQKQCKYCDEFVKKVCECFQLEIRAPFEFIPAFIDYSLNPSAVSVQMEADQKCAAQQMEDQAESQFASFSSLQFQLKDSLDAVDLYKTQFSQETFASEQIR